MRQTQMPYYTTVEGKPTELCVFAAREEACKRKNCPYGHDPKSRRICRAFHTKGEYCADGENCLLGHHEARAALEEQKRFKKVINSNYMEAHGGYNQDDGGQANGGANGTGTIPNQAATTQLQGVNPSLNSNPQPMVLDQQAQVPPAPAQIPTHVLIAPVQTIPIAPVQTISTLQNTGAPNQIVPNVNFQTLARQNVAAGQEDEIARLKKRQDEIAKEYEALKLLTTAKEDDMRKLQTTLGEIQNENERLKDENDHLESKSPKRPSGPLQKYYEDLPADSFTARSLIDLNS